MSKRPPIIRIRCEVSEDECCSSSGGEEVSSLGSAGWHHGFDTTDRMSLRGENSSSSVDKRHSSPDIRISESGNRDQISGVDGGNSSSNRSLLANSNSRHSLLSPLGHQHDSSSSSSNTVIHTPTPISPLAKHPLLGFRNIFEKRLSAPSCLAPPSPLAFYSSGHNNSVFSYNSPRHSLEETSQNMDHHYSWLYRRLARSQRRRFSDTTRIDRLGKV